MTLMILAGIVTVGSALGDRLGRMRMFRWGVLLILAGAAVTFAVINSAMLDQLVKDADGGFTLYVQHESPGRDKEANWLPVPKEKFNLTFRAYQPEQAILDFTYHAPPVVMLSELFSGRIDTQGIK